MMTTSAPRSPPARDRVEGDGARVRALGAGDDVAAGALGPLSSCSTAAARKVSAAPSTTVLPSSLLQVPGELADRRRLAGAVDADGHDHRRVVAYVDAVLARAGDAGEQLDEPLLQRLAALDHARGRLLLELADDLRGRRRADVGHDQRLLQALPRLVVERVEERRLDLGRQRLARLGHVLAQALEEPAALLGLGVDGDRVVVAGDEQVSPVAGHGFGEDSGVRFERADPSAPPASDLLAAMGDEILAMYDHALDAPDMPKAGPAELSAPRRLAARRLRRRRRRRLRRRASSACRTVPARSSGCTCAEPARGRGVARRLLAALEDEARALGYAIVRLDTGPAQHSARRMYEEAGYAEIDNFNANPVATFFGEKRL